MVVNGGLYMFIWEYLWLMVMNSELMAMNGGNLRLVVNLMVITLWQFVT